MKRILLIAADESPFKNINRRLDRIEALLERMLPIMSDMETQLDAVIAEVATTVGEVVDLVGQVLAKLNDAGSPVDLSDETQTLTDLQTKLQGAVDSMTSAVEPAPAPEPTTPPADTTEPSSTTDPTEEPTGTEPV